ncbi:sulfatase family protein [Larkinella terrae]|uniref:Sulfatase-like hydrolase/transferase n=1 Tax=Larkinella terrae TaxID=2025311 RepID=A0A7K0ESF5_9BACT|nr:sulfatase [Larkinella terrae]MRS64740.1 sulfatase-like hydrolase/transferase [Larkinella terrae]
MNKAVSCVAGVLSTVLLAVFGPSFIAEPPVNAPENAPEKPNIIFLLTDDHRWDALGAMGNRIIQTPNLDALAKKGILYPNMYVTTAICCVSRASILSGQYESRHKINDFVTDFTPEALANTYPMLLKKAGYNIGFVGKYGVGENPPDNRFDYWACNRKGQPPYEYTNQSGQKIHHTDSVAHSMQLCLKEFAGKGPFCLSVSFKAPHELDGNPPTYPVQERFANLYKNVTVPTPETADPKYWNSFPDFFRTDKNIGRERWKPLFSTPELHQETVKDYYRLVTGVDEVVGKLVDQLKQLKLDKNTIIVFSGDNGFYLGEHGMEGKWFGHEESIRVPLIIYNPSLPASKRGTRSNRMALNIDIAPTLLAFAGVDAPKTMQGTDLMKTADRSDFFYEHTFMGSPRLPKVEGVVTQDFKYMKFIEHGYEELYSVKSDPHETKNLASDPTYAQQLNQLRSRYRVLKEMAQ